VGSQPSTLPCETQRNPFTRSTNGRKAQDVATGDNPLTVDEFCAIYKVSRSTFYDWRAKGRAPKCRKLPNGEIRIRSSDADRWFDGCSEGL
jgi:predicted DNA-binding transcriptional regulator AlpA